jgi:DUF1365 family protein
MSGGNIGEFKSALVRGHVVHARNDVHARRTFRYPVYVASIDLDELPALDRSLRLFSHDGPNLFALDDCDYEAARPRSPAAGGIARAYRELLDQHGVARPVQIRLVTNLRVLGYVFNPVSFFLGYDERGAITSVVAEVNNNYGGRHRYVFGPEHRVAHPRRVGFRRERVLFVSPFLHGDATYELWVDAPLDGEKLDITMHVDVADGRVFVARLAGTREAMSDRALVRAAVRYPLMTAQVIGLIHYEALKLRLLGVPYRRPGADHRPIREPHSIVSKALMK